MPRYVALFRGINVGKAKRIAMADLRSLLEDLGYTDVKTLLNSGNAVFAARAGSPEKMAARIRSAVAADLGVDAMVIVKSGQDVAAMIAGNRLDNATDPSRRLVAVCEGKALSQLEPLGRKDWGRERIHVGKHAAYIWCADGILESEALGVLMKGLGSNGTTRNWATLGKIHALMTGGS